MTARTDEELRSAYNYYVIVNPQTLFNGLGEPYFLYYGEKYYLREMQDWLISNAEANDSEKRRTVKIPKF